jgi:uncharacterized ferritin-like protein (DUF455 family)
MNTSDDDPRDATIDRGRHVAETVEAWCAALIEEKDFAVKLGFSRAPSVWVAQNGSGVGVPAPPAPGRPAAVELRTTTRRSLRRGQLRTPAGRAELLHRLLHHEVQAAELMAWALLAFPGAEPRFRRGLLAILRDELRHARGYRDLLARAGVAYGDLPVRDWFWERATSCASPLQFVALMGLGLEGANIDHTERFAGRFREAGDEEAAVFLERVGREEEAHVRFALRWFRLWAGRPGAGAEEFARWAEELVPPLGPKMFRAQPMNRAGRMRAGLDPVFLDLLEQAGEDR